MIRLWIRKKSKGFFSGLLSRFSEVKEIESALKYRFEFEKLIANISAHFISLTVDKMNEAIPESFEKICRFAEVDRAYIFWYKDIVGRKMEKIHEWCSDGITSQLNRVRELNMEMFPCFEKAIKNLQPFIADRVDDLPPEAVAEKKEFSSQKVLSFLFVPLIYEGKAIGFMGFEMLRCEVQWSEDILSLLKVVSETFVNALQRIRADKTLRQSEERYALIARGVNDGLWDWNIKTNQVFYSPRWKSMLGYEEEQISDQLSEWIDRIHPEDEAFVNQKLDEHLKGYSSHCEIEFRMHHKNGDYRWVLVRGLAVKDSKGRIWRMAGSLTDITDRIQFEEKLKHSALHDSLTGLPNRIHFLEHLKRAVTRSKEDPDFLFAVLFIDLDRFKTINDSFGHLFGDDFLILVGKEIESCVGSGNIVARFGGDEFTILLENITREHHAVVVAERIQKILLQPFTLQNQTIITSASIGIALSSAADIESEADLLRNADTAMYRAKSTRKGGHVIYNEAMHSQVLETLQIENDLRRALEQNQFEVHYQPIIDLKDNLVTGFEALLRWHHPERGEISPTVFIPLAEETGTIIPIGKWVLRQACKEASKWPKIHRAPLSISINLSVKQFMDPTLIKEIKSILYETGLDPECLHLEITESVLIEDDIHAAEVLSQLRNLNIKLYLDDFGTGYSSLSYLHRFPLDVLKIDRSFIRAIGQKGENSEVTKTIMSMAHNLNLKIVAEGIETEEQLEFLKSRGCDYGQGFLFAKPLNLTDANIFALNRQTSIRLHSIDDPEEKIG